MSASSVIHFVTGSDEAEVKKTAAALATQLAPSDNPFAVETIQGNVATVEEATGRLASAIEGLLTLPFFGGAKLVWLKNASFLADTVLGRSESVLESLEKLISVLKNGLPPNVTFLLSAPEADKRRAVYKALSKLGTLHLRDKPDFGWGASEQDVIDWVLTRTNAAGLVMEEAAAATLAAHVGAETRQLDIEIEKLLLAFGRGKMVSTREVLELVPATRQGGIFDLSNTILRRDLPDALRCLRQLLYQNESAIGILIAAILPTIRNLLSVKDLLVTNGLPAPAQARFFAATINKLPPDATAHLPRKKDGSLNAYPLGLASAASKKFSLKELQNAFLACSRANLDLVTSRMPDETVLHKLLIEMLG